MIASGPRRWGGGAAAPDRRTISFPAKKPSTIFSTTFFEDFLGAARPRARRRRGADLTYNFEISLEEAFSGADQEIQILQKTFCPVCQGSRCAPGARPVSCPNCGGRGSLRTQRGFFVTDSACPRCQGQGELVLNPCGHCGEKGGSRSGRRSKSAFPRAWMRARVCDLKGAGEKSDSGGSSGDLYIVISLRKHPVFTRTGKRSLL